MKLLDFHILPFSTTALLHPLLYLHSLYIYIYLLSIIKTAKMCLQVDTVHKQLEDTGPECTIIIASDLAQISCALTVHDIRITLC